MGRRRQEGHAFKETQRTEPKNPDNLEEGEQDWSTHCTVCDETPTVFPTGLCGPCCYGDGGMAGGNW
jgi:hypothetical protein